MNRDDPVEVLYDLDETLHNVGQQRAKEHEHLFRSLLAKVKPCKDDQYGQAESLACHLLTKYVGWFPQLAAQCVDPLLELCVEATRATRVNAIRALQAVSKTQELTLEDIDKIIREISNILEQEDDKVLKRQLNTLLSTLLKIVTGEGFDSPMKSSKSPHADDAEVAKAAQKRDEAEENSGTEVGNHHEERPDRDGMLARESDDLGEPDHRSSKDDEDFEEMRSSSGPSEDQHRESTTGEEGKCEAQKENGASVNTRKVRRPTNVMYLGNIPISTKLRDIKGLMEGLGVSVGKPVIRIESPGPTDRENGRTYAFVEFQTVENATAAITHCNGRELGGLVVSANYGHYPASDTLYVSPVTGLNREEIYREFSRFGTVRDVRIRDKLNCAFVVYKSIDEARQAVQNTRQGFKLANRALRVAFAGERKEVEQTGLSKPVVAVAPEPVAPKFSAEITRGGKTIRVGNVRDEDILELLSRNTKEFGECTLSPWNVGDRTVTVSYRSPKAAAAAMRWLSKRSLREGAMPLIVVMEIPPEQYPKVDHTVVVPQLPGQRQILQRRQQYVDRRQEFHSNRPRQEPQSRYEESRTHESNSRCSRKNSGDWADRMRDPYEDRKYSRRDHEDVAEDPRYTREASTESRWYKRRERGDSRLGRYISSQPERFPLLDSRSPPESWKQSSAWEQERDRYGPARRDTWRDARRGDSYSRINERQRGGRSDQWDRRHSPHHDASFGRERYNDASYSHGAPKYHSDRSSDHNVRPHARKRPRYEREHWGEGNRPRDEVTAGQRDNSAVGDDEEKSTHSVCAAEARHARDTAGRRPVQAKRRPPIDLLQDVGDDEIDYGSDDNIDDQKDLRKDHLASNGRDRRRHTGTSSRP